MFPPGALAIDAPISCSNGSVPPQIEASFPLPFASSVHTKALAPELPPSVRMLPVTCTLPSGPTATSCAEPNPGPPTTLARRSCPRCRSARRGGSCDGARRFLREWLGSPRGCLRESKQRASGPHKSRVAIEAAANVSRRGPMDFARLRDYDASAACASFAHHCTKTGLERITLDAPTG